MKSSQFGEEHTQAINVRKTASNYPGNLCDRNDKTIYSHKILKGDLSVVGFLTRNKKLVSSTYFLI